MAPPKKKATPKATAVDGAGVKKPTGKGMRRKDKRAASERMAQMHSYFKKHRAEFKDLEFKDQQRELGKLWKTAPENPKNAS